MKRAGHGGFDKLSQSGIWYKPDPLRLCLPKSATCACGWSGPNG